ncbi:hypothetical protein Agabi119p4_2868 [Agaricus bisporus var. burnettii]|uniref:SAC domain-containing protein n=1 Tax=Agaricus bisporus var. burnettii TaxID=192524 RepID=A0A8H7KIM5_AGABI|nr:hypothetical protein Agabi119p4_2868 [Agaricus bisporus var. burnettii]
MKRLFARGSRRTSKSPAIGEHDILHTQPSTSAGMIHAPALQPKYVVPPVPHPCPHDHILALVTKDGLLLRPQIPGHESDGISGSYVRLAWGKGIILEEVINDEEQHDWSDGVVIYGIVGGLELYTTSYLLVITSRSEAGHFLDPTHIVYGVKSVVAIPLLEESARSTVKAISSRNAALARPSLIPKVANEANNEETDGLLSDSLPPLSRVKFSTDPQVHLVPPNIKDDEYLYPHTPPSASSSTSLLSSEVPTATPILKTVSTRLSFWSKMSKPSSSSAQELPFRPIPDKQEKDALDKIIREESGKPANVIDKILATTAPPPKTAEEQHSELEDKVIRECIREFTKGDMYFSYTFDITRSIQHKQEQHAKSHKKNELLAGLGAIPSSEAGVNLSAISEPYPTLPLWRRVDKQFWWNEWMSKHFIDAGLHSYVLPLMQGYFQTTQLVVSSELGENEECPVDYIITSRRSRDRAGLRYQRRGIDEEANVANFVETETIMRLEREGKENVFSHVQIRGSIPLFWTQSGYSLKPPPVLAPDRSHEQNLDAIRRHFEKTIPVYGPHVIVNLAEQHGKEGAITQAYRDHVKEAGLDDVQYHEYDFHAETKGMKYENISKLTDTLERVFEGQGFLWMCDGTVLSQQKSVYRINCIDCLDRTNVVQSAFARHIMNRQLGALALLNPSITTKRPDIDLVFNDVWANNGDAISRAYAGTSALKGDFTRTGKRDLSGLLNDGVNSLARMYTSTFSDWFCQAVIDFMLGNRTISVFSEFLLKLQSSDPRDLIRLSKIRTEAIATSVARVLPEGEGLLSGWTLFAPEELNVKLGSKFEEKVLLLTIKALYIVSYDYTLEKVKIYTRVPLGDITGISKGAYILSPLEEASRDPEQNSGFIITWINSNQESRASSYSVRNKLWPSGDLTSPTSPTSPLQPQTWGSSRRSTVNLSRLLANSFAASGTSETTFAAFKVLPIEPARFRQGTGTTSGPYSETSEEIAGASSCREIVDRIVESIGHACENVGGGGDRFIIDEDVISVADAQKSTTMYAKMEYGVKRLLWLGG